MPKLLERKNNLKGKHEDLTGQKFNRLTVIELYKINKDRRKIWLCKCDCGNFSKVNTTNLKSEHTQSCGCLQIENLLKKCVKHHETKTRLYNIWGGLKGRCLCKRNDNFKSYGERGIDVCEEWKNSFETFRDWSLSNGYSDELSIDRIDNDLGYRPNNCRWADRVTQNNNTRRNRIVDYEGELKTVAQLCRDTGTDYQLVTDRLNRGYSVEDSVHSKLYSNHKKKVIQNG